MQQGEFELIEKIKQQLQLTQPTVVRGMGDDAAVIRKNETTFTVMSTDTLIEGVHFDLSYFSFFELGQKSMAVNLSDMAAMGAQPQTVLVSLAIPPHVTEKNILDFYLGLEDQLKIYGGAIVGGDTSKSHHDFMVSLTITGECAQHECKFRNTAQPGDTIYVSGPLGMAALGLVALQSKRSAPPQFIQALKTPKPCIQLGLLLAKQSCVHAMMDISDGLLQDLNHILKASQLGAEICLDDIPVAEHFETTCADLHQDDLELRLSGGEDYQLLFTVASKQTHFLEEECAKNGFSIYPIGSVVNDTSIRACRLMRRTGLEYQPKKLGFDHFKEKM